MATFQVTYEIRSGVADGVVGSGDTLVQADDDAQARQVALAWVHENDRNADPRVDPKVRVRTCRPA